MRAQAILLSLLLIAYVSPSTSYCLDKIDLEAKTIRDMQISEIGKISAYGIPRDSNLFIVASNIFDDAGRPLGGMLHYIDGNGQISLTENFSGSHLEGRLFVSNDSMVDETGSLFERKGKSWVYSGELFRLPSNPYSDGIVLSRAAGLKSSFWAIVNRQCYFTSKENLGKPLGTLHIENPDRPARTPTPGSDFNPISNKTVPFKERYVTRMIGDNKLFIHLKNSSGYGVFSLDTNRPSISRVNSRKIIPCRSIDINISGRIAGLILRRRGLLWISDEKYEKTLKVHPKTERIFWLPSNRILTVIDNGHNALVSVDAQTMASSNPHWLDFALDDILIHPQKGYVLCFCDEGNWSVLREKDDGSFVCCTRSQSEMPMKCISFCPKQQKFIAMRKDGQLYTLDYKSVKKMIRLETISPLSNYRRIQNYVNGGEVNYSVSESNWNALAISSDGNIVISGGHPGVLRITDLSNLGRNFIGFIGGIQIQSLQFGTPINGNRTIIVYDRSNRIRVFQTHFNGKSYELQLLSEIVGNFGFAYDLEVCMKDRSQGLLAASYNNGIRSFNVTTGTVMNLEGFEENGFGVASIPGSYNMIAGQNVGTDRFLLIKYNLKEKKTEWKKIAETTMEYGAMTANTKYWAICDKDKLLIGKNEDGAILANMLLPEEATPEASQVICFFPNSYKILVGTLRGKILLIK